MIITRLKASNLLKYERLDLNLPESGLIAISGQNESGKSSIGEAVCFALFGRTFSITEDDRHKVVRWGENHCAVTLFFKVKSTHYELTRFLDNDGNHSAKLSLAGSEDPLVRGVTSVDEALVEMLGFEYEQFVESFYLAQREITTPHPHSQAVKIMAGVATLEQVEREVEREIEERNELLDEVQAEVESIDQEIADLGLEVGFLQRLENERLETIDQAEQVRHLSGQMDAQLTVYVDNSKKIYRAEAAKSRAGFMRFAFALLALLGGTGWWLLGDGSGMPVAEQFRSLLDQYLPQWQTVPHLWIGYAAAGFFALFLLAWIRVGSHASRARRLRKQSGELAETLVQARDIELEFSEDEAAPLEAVESDLVDDDVEDVEVEELPERPERELLDAIVENVAAGQATARQAREYTDAESAWLKHVAELLVAEVNALDEVIVDERARLQEADNLNQVRKGVLDKRDELAGRIALRRKSLELLAGAIGHLSNNFNRDIKDLVARMLPLFTDGRYEHLQINGDLRVRVFSAEKRDFMDLEEVSSGTQRQIMLALRLALSQKLLSRTVSGQQFAFLDEPFAFFDEERTRKALAALANLGKNISQVWIVAQTFPDNAQVAYDARIECQRGQDTLSLGSPVALAELPALSVVDESPELAGDQTEDLVGASEADVASATSDDLTAEAQDEA